MTSASLLKKPDRKERPHHPVVRQPRALATTLRAEFFDLFNQLCYISGTVERISHAKGKVHLLLTDLKVSTYSQSLLNTNERETIDSHHAWLEATDCTLIPPIGAAVSTYGVCVKYYKRTGQLSYGFASYNASCWVDIAADVASDLLLQITSDVAGGRSPSGSVDKAFNHLEERIRLYPLEDYDPFGLINFGLQGRQETLAFLRKYHKHTIRLLKRGDIEKATELLKELATVKECYVKGYTENT